MQVARLHLVEKVGAGAYGIVYRGYLRTGEIVGVKKISKLKRTPEALRRFQVEIVAAHSLHHEHIVKVYQVIETTEDISIVMEYADGKSTSLEHNNNNRK